MGRRGAKPKWTDELARLEIARLTVKSPKSGAERALLSRLHRRLGVRVSRNYWLAKDWPGAASEVIRRGHCRHLGDLLLRLGLPYRTHRIWYRNHPTWAAATTGLSPARQRNRHTSKFCEHIRLSAISE